MKKESGITLSALVITIIVIFILASISINYGVDTLNESKAKNLAAAVEMVEQAVAEQYIKALELNLTGIKKSEASQPSIFIGTIVKPAELPTISDSIEFQLKASLEAKNENDITYDEACYRLTPEDLLKLKIEGNEDNNYTYIVNYSTGEVFNETQKQTSKGDILYYAGKTGNKSPEAEENEKAIDTNNFTE